MKYDEFCLDMNERRSQPELLKKVKPGSVVLELGPYTGIMTNYMKNSLNCKVYICEFDPVAIAYSKQYAEDAWQGDLETLDWVKKFENMKFDYIICADVLEHLREPLAVLRATKPLLKDDGSVLLSIPNIAHNSVIYGLLHNQFEYTINGILDQTHLRFFTYASAKRLCEDAGYTAVEQDAIHQDFTPPASDSPQGLPLNKEFGTVLQFLFELKKADYAAENHLPLVNKILDAQGDPIEKTPGVNPSKKQKHDLKFIAFYLPQFHQIAENDRWWGEGFTDWTNTKKARPLFEGHRQPREPLDDHYYDLSDINSLKWQAELMKKYNVYGLCIYHYWFNGKLLLEKPMELLLQNKEIEMNYCISWANESWTRNWDGGSREILMPQVYGSKDDWKRHFDYLLPFFKDERYIKIDHKPLFTMYLSAQIKNGSEIMHYWNQLAKENGFDGLFVAETLNAKQNKLCMAESDAFIEFEPCYTLYDGYFGHYYLKTLDSFFYDQVWEKILERKKSYGSREKFCGAFVDWDNTPRMGMRGSACIGATPERFKKYLGALAKKCIAEGNDRFLFINAWNEWGEGAYLEPDKCYAYQYLEAIKDIAEEIQKQQL